MPHMLRKSGLSVRFPEAGVTGGWEPPTVVLGTKLRSPGRAVGAQPLSCSLALTLWFYSHQHWDAEIPSPSTFRALSEIFSNSVLIWNPNSFHNLYDTRVSISNGTLWIKHFDKFIQLDSHMQRSDSRNTLSVCAHHRPSRVRAGFVCTVSTAVYKAQYLEGEPRCFKRVCWHSAWARTVQSDCVKHPTCTVHHG